MSRDRKKSGGRDFQPGQSGNPNGRPRLAPEIREFRTAAKEQIIEEVKYLWSLPIQDLQQIAGEFRHKKITNEETGEAQEQDVFESEFGEVPAIRVAIAKILLNTAKHGDMFKLDRILDRVIGKVKEEVDLNHGLQDSFHSKVVDMIEKLDQPNKTEVSNGNKEAGKEENKSSKKD